MKLEKRKRPRVFEEWVLLTSPKSSVVVCLRAQQQQQRKEKKTKKKPKVSGVCQVSLCSLFSSLYLFHCAPTALGFIHTSSPLVFSKRKKKRKKKVEKGGRRRKSHQQYLRCGMLEASGYPGLSSLISPHVWIEIQREGKADQEIGIFAVGEEVVGSAGLLCSAVRGQEDPPPSPLLFRTLMGGDRAQHKEKMKMKTWAVTTAIV